jgi:hypothetical protein
VFDRVGEQLASLRQIIAGIEHSLDLRAVLGPLLPLKKLRSSARRGLSFFSSGQSSDQSSLMRSAGQNAKSNNAVRDVVCCHCSYFHRLRCGCIPLRSRGPHVHCCLFISRRVAVGCGIGIDNVGRIPAIG